MLLVWRSTIPFRSRPRGGRLLPLRGLTYGQPLCFPYLDVSRVRVCEPTKSGFVRSSPTYPMTCPPAFLWLRKTPPRDPTGDSTPRLCCLPVVSTATARLFSACFREDAARVFREFLQSFRSIFPRAERPGATSWQAASPPKRPHNARACFWRIASDRSSPSRGAQRQRDVVAGLQGPCIFGHLTAPLPAQRTTSPFLGYL